MLVYLIGKNEVILSSYPENISYEGKINHFIERKNTTGTYYSNEPLGTLLIKFIQKDFTHVEGYIDFVYDYKMTFLSAYLPERYLHYLNDPIKLNDFFESDDFIDALKETYTKLKNYFIEIQKAFDEALKFVLDIDSPNNNEFKDCPPTQRYFIYNQIKEAQDFSFDIFSENLRVYKKSLPLDFSNFKKLNAKNPSLIKATEFYLADISDSDDIGSIIYVTFMEMIRNNIYVKKCKHCNKYFIITGRIDTEYCDNPASGYDNKTCKEVGPLIDYNLKVKNNLLLKEYQRLYKSKHAGLRKITNPATYKIEKEKLIEWRIKVKPIADKGEMTLEEFKEWLKQ